jgi:hypothetical protein
VSVPVSVVRDNGAAGRVEASEIGFVGESGGIVEGAKKRFAIIDKTAGGGIRGRKIEQWLSCGTMMRESFAQAIGFEVPAGAVSEHFWGALC